MYDDPDIVNIVIDELGAEYDNFVTSLHIHDSTTFMQMYHLLIWEERSLKKQTEIARVGILAFATFSRGCGHDRGH